MKPTLLRWAVWGLGGLLLASSAFQDPAQAQTSAPKVAPANTAPAITAPAGTAKSIQGAMLPPIKPLFDFPVRDPAIILAGDGNYYLTGTTGYPNWWTQGEGIRVWRAKSLDGPWEPLGLVWNLWRDGTWQRDPNPRTPIAVWAPEIHYLKGTFWLTHSIVKRRAGKPPETFSGLLKSESGKPEGPYVDAAKEPLAVGIDASLFQDDDGAVYWLWANGQIARMNDDMSALAEKPRLLKPANSRHVGWEGAFLTKINGRYHLSCAEFATPEGTSVDFKGGPIKPEWTYSCFAASSDKLMGPYGPAYLAIPHAGHNMFFRDKQGQLYSTFFGNDRAAPFQERAAILPVEVGPDQRIRPVVSLAR